MNLDAVIPVRDAVSEPWFAAVAEGRLMIQRDPVSGAAQMYPRARVAGAPEREPEWIEASGRGTLYTYTVVKRSLHREFAGAVPFVLALVDLEEGARITAWVVDVAEGDLRCDMPLAVAFREILPGLTMPVFTAA